MLDLSGLDSIRVTDERVAVIEADVRLAQVYAALHACDRTLPGGCGHTVGAEGSGHIYPNFPDSALEGWALEYHGDKYSRPAAIKNAYDPHRFFQLPQAT